MQSNINFSVSSRSVLEILVICHFCHSHVWSLEDFCKKNWKLKMVSTMLCPLPPSRIALHPQRHTCPLHPVGRETRQFVSSQLEFQESGKSADLLSRLESLQRSCLVMRDHAADKVNCRVTNIPERVLANKLHKQTSHRFTCIHVCGQWQLIHETSYSMFIPCCMRSMEASCARRKVQSWIAQNQLQISRLAAEDILTTKNFSKETTMITKHLPSCCCSTTHASNLAQCCDLNNANGWSKR